MKKNIEKDRLTILRERAETFLGQKGCQLNDNLPDEIRKILHELHTHQIELVLQNEELLETHIKLEESRALYVDLYDYAPVGYFSFNVKGLVLAANHTGCRQLGLEKDTLLNKSFSFFMSQDDADLFYLHLQKVFTTGVKQSCSLKIFQKNGNSFHARLDSIPSSRGSGKERLCRTTVTNVNESAELEEALKVSETRYRRLFEAAREGILILDAETGQISDVNPFLMEMLDYSHEELSGKKLWEIGCFQDMEASKGVFEKLRSKGFVRYDNLPLETKNGRVIAVEFISTLYLVNNHKVIQCHIRDITRRKLYKENSWQPYAGKERRVEERRTEPRMLSESLEYEKYEHQQTEETLRKALEEIETLKDRLVGENIYFHQQIKKKHLFDDIIGQSDGLKYVLYRAEQVAPIDTTVLILGETGTGKELIAAAIHQLSPRRDRPLMTVNCAALPANLLESELFGREKGAFTGADCRQIGRFEIADGATLCLDEIGELPLEMQAKLLRVIQHGEFERLGSSKTIKVDVRIIATTNRNLEDEIETGRFRKDLFYRLNVFPITVPPLRRRSEDIPILVQTFVERYARKLGKQITSIPKQTMKILQEYPWPGNIRELESIIERSVILCAGPGFQLADTLTSSFSESFPTGTIKDMERQLILQALSETGWRIEGKDGAARVLGLHPSTLRARMHKLSIVRPHSVSPV
ncbi:MAG: sigma 54-interacting transcriptional regulator [Desulfobulbaceae bacterium]|nr:sigma 54-interacting transcriptional regulator [Desulfobulbaceae bacterium]